MDLRDQFAIAALTGLLAADDTAGGASDFADDAYRYADAMLAAKDRQAKYRHKLDKRC